MNKEQTPVRERLLALQDEKYRQFHSKLIPTVPPQTVIGIRVPQLRHLAAEIDGSALCEDFLRDLPHKYYDENMLHALLVARTKDLEMTYRRLEAFLPYVDNWAVCDCMNPKVFRSCPDGLLEKIKTWIGSALPYTSRFGIEMLMNFYLDEHFSPDLLPLVNSAVSEDYYVKMMIAWFYATALAKQYDCALASLERDVSDAWTHNKAIQKAIESYRITDAQKSALRTLKRRD